MGGQRDGEVDRKDGQQERGGGGYRLGVLSVYSNSSTKILYKLLPIGDQ